VQLAAPEPAAQLDVAATPFIELLISTRADLRAAKQWALADKIRNELKTLGVILDDTPEGAQWRFEQG
jgi:cysteinyl-tRNA synthetase